MTMTTCARMQEVQAPIIPIIGEWSRQHPGTISLGQGVVGYGPPPEVHAQLSEFVGREEIHRYHDVGGIPPLKESIRCKLERDNGIVLGRGDPSEQSGLCVTAGANTAFMNAVLALTDPGDEIILLKPYYFNHEMAVRIAGCLPVIVDTDDTFHPVPDWIAARITERTRAVVTISPNNPTGVVYPQVLLQEINTLCGRHGIFHIHDETYEYFTYNGINPFSPGSMPGSGAHTISLYSLSKAYGLAGWRVGYMVFPLDLEDSIKKIQDTTLICPPVMSQIAAMGALQAGKAYCTEKQLDHQEIRTVMWQAFDELRDLCQVQAADGAFYFFLKVDTQLSALDVAERLIREFGVAIIPGETFGAMDGCYLRLSHGALDRQTAAKGLDRLICGLRSIVKHPATVAI